MRVFALGCVSLRDVLGASACVLLLGFAIGARAQTVQAGSITTASGAASPPSAPAATPAPSRLDEILARGTLRVCTTGDYKPYSFLRPDGQFEGIDIDAAQNLAQSMNVKAEFIKTSWSNLMSDFIAKCDIAVGGVSTTLERQKRAFFTQPYMVDGKTPIVRCGDVDKYQTVAQIDQPGVRTIVKQILDGQADVMVTDASETLLQQKLNPGLCSVHPDKPFQFGEKAYLLPRGDVAFQQYVDQWLHLSRSTGEFQAVLDKWLK
jgi:cyclohexadienyl dehydratase